ncbi:phospholipase effector Tle1 domain-containing protein [Chryseobacterium gambrini]|uniref:phospholipase effector Tle1 domain-containing protein n=1 Tax=Chryseobacterium gambrini TaxID=373672 RepID=UPI0022F1C0C3|nr:DUF2235 domain-containing protein [Chryseobacterium gambrini]WBV51109.1 DUF2235 domain-containing protein [Chryseobacterium gambrini]
MKTGNIGIRNLADIGVEDIDVYGTDKRKYKAFEKTEKVKLRIGVFFDGTGNNKYNSDTKYYKLPLPIDENNLPKNKFNGFVPESGSSYWNNYSNVALLHDLYQIDIKEKTDKYAFYYLQLRQYVEGIGTKKYEEDDVFGSGFGEGERGIVERVKEGCEKIVEQLQEELKKIQASSVNKFPLEIVEIKFDVFGFSRGAAAARHFCNEVLKREQIAETITNKQNKDQKKQNDFPTNKDLLKKETDITLKKPLDNMLHPSDTGSYMQYLFQNKIKMEYPVDRVSVEFLGIFDTVISQMLEKNNIIDVAKSIEDNKNIVKIVEKVGVLGCEMIIPPSPISNVLKPLVPLAGEIITQKLLKLNKKVADLPKANPYLKHRNLKKVFHIMASSDWRKNFPVTPVTDAFDSRQIWMLGAHSDIGGGYADAKVEEKVLHFMDVSVNASSEKKAKAQQERNDLRNWYINNYYCEDSKIKWDEYHHILATDKNYFIPKTKIIIKPKEFMGSQITKTEGQIEYNLFAYHYKLNAERVPSNKLSVVALKVMHHMAMQYGGVPFFDDHKIAKPDVKYPFEYELPQELQNYYDTIKAVAETGWKKDNSGKVLENRDLFFDYEQRIYKLNPDDYKLINKKYVHLSASYNGRLAKDKTDQYVNAATSDAIDHIPMLYANEPQFNENENNRTKQPYQRLFYTPKLSKKDTIKSH